MSDTTEASVLEGAVVKEMVRQMRAIDTYGSYDSWTVERILAPFVLTKEQRREIPVIGDPDEITLSRVRAYYNAVASLIEQRCGLMAIPMLNLSHEGFGRVAITVGKLVVLDKTLRDIHRFGFNDLAQLVQEAEKLLTAALGLITLYRPVAEL